MLLTTRVAKILTRTERIRCYTMETPSHKKLYVHYNHTDSCRDARWNARECYQFMYGRAWEPVVGFYANLVNGCLSLSTMFGTEMPVSTETSILDGEIVGVSEELKLLNPKDRGGRWARLTFKIILSYHGGSFDGWQKQPDLNTVQGLVEKSLGRFVDDRKVKLLKEKSLPVEGGALVAGRTDKGVTALQQVCSFYTWREDVRSGEIMEAINNAAPGMIRVISVLKVSRAFHPNFSATWRHYLYVFPLNDGVEDQDCSGEKNNDVVSLHSQNDAQNRHLGEYIEGKHEFVTLDAEIEFDGRTKPRSFSVSRVNQLLQQLEGKTLSYKTFARDTKASRSTGPPTECFLYHARAAEAMLPSTDDLHSSQALADAGNCARGTKVMCVELIANRFLRKMVRVLVATSIREAAAGAEDDALLKLMEATCRRATAPPAPPEGLCLVDVGYREFRPENCLIP